MSRLLTRSRLLATTILTILIACGAAHAQTQLPVTVWSHSYGGSSNETARGIVRTADSGFVIGGTTSSRDGDATGSHGLADYWVFKVNRIGKLVWQRSYGGSLIDGMSGFWKAHNNGFIATGTSNSVDGDNPRSVRTTTPWTLLLDSNGNITRRDTTLSIYSIQALTGGGYIAAGNCPADNYWIARLDDTLGVIWQRCYGGSKTDSAAHVIQTLDGGFVVAGSTNSTDGDIVGNGGNTAFASWVIKLDASGALQWSRSYRDGTPKQIRQLADSSYLLAGTTSARSTAPRLHGTAKDFWLIKLRPNGDTVWQSAYGGNFDESLEAMELIAGNRMLLIGSTSQGRSGDITGARRATDSWIMVVDSVGGLLWQQTLGGTAYESLIGVVQTTDQGLVLAGYTTSIDIDVPENRGATDIWLIQLGQSLNSPARSYGANYAWGGSNVDYPVAICSASDSGYIVGANTSSTDGTVLGYHGLSDYWVFKVNTGGAITWQRCLGGSNADTLTGIWNAENGSVIASGRSISTDGDVRQGSNRGIYWAVKLDRQGRIQGQNAGLAIGSLKLTRDGNYIVTGGCATDNLWIALLDTSFAVKWQQCLGGSGTDKGMDVIQSADGGFVVVGNTTSSDGDISDYKGVTERVAWVLKLSASGTVQWKKTYSDGAGLRILQQQQDSSLIIGGNTTTVSTASGAHGSNPDYWIAKLTPSGDIQSQWAYGSDSAELLSTIEPVTGGGFLLSGQTSQGIRRHAGGDVGPVYGQTDAWVLRTDNSGKVLWSRVMGGTYYDRACAAVHDAYGSVMVVSSTNSIDNDVQSFFGSSDVWIVKFQEPLRVGSSNAGSRLLVSPNPVHDRLNVHLGAAHGTVTALIMDVTGRTVKAIRLDAGRNVIGVEDLQPGSYFLKLDNMPAGSVFIKY